MERLYLLRHGIAVPHGSPEFEDDDRPLTPKGGRRIKQIARGLERLGLEVDRIASSPLPRALETAEIVARVLGLEDRLETDDALRSGRSAESIREWLGSRPEARLMIVGHDPSFSDLVGMLTVGEAGRNLASLRKGGLAALRGKSEGGYGLEWLARPALFRRLTS